MIAAAHEVHRRAVSDRIICFSAWLFAGVAEKRPLRGKGSLRFTGFALCGHPGQAGGSEREQESRQIPDRALRPARDDSAATALSAGSG
jgi:hypothetical protein